jgi:hypothetical protein
VDTVEAPAVVVTWAAHDALWTRYIGLISLTADRL